MKFFLWAIAGIAVLAAAVGGVFYEHPLWVADQQIRLHLRQSHVESEYVQAGAYRLHYFEALPPKGGPERPLLLVHGLGSRGEDWSPLIPGLAAAGFHVYVPDLLGYGRSPQPDVDYSIPLEEKTVLDFMNAVHIDKADVAGWSMGGWVAMRIAADHPERVERLVLYDSAGLYFQFDPTLFLPTDGAGLQKLMAAISPKPRAMPGFVQQDALRKLHSNAWVVKRSIAAMTNGKDLMDFRLWKIHEPTLIVWGGHDDLIPIEAGERLHRGISGSVFEVMEGCGHLAPAECYRPVESATLAFLTADPAPQGGEQRIPAAGN